MVIARAVGFESVADSVAIETGKETVHDFVLTRVVLLDSVVTTAAHPTYISGALRGFEERRASGIGHFVAEAELRKHDSDQLSDLLRTKIPGLRLIRVRDGQYAIAGHTAKTGSFSASSGGSVNTIEGPFPSQCYVTVYLDGTRIFDLATRARAMQPPPNIDDYSINRLAGVEYYAGEATIPAQFDSRSGCGALLLWTRER
ncbi:MAG TPA: hypothetical protein VHV78_13825 [Gemmatimonadaceae bacterium]|nr:hypothetical protein [Gemmatimonadaceae bacterium]